MKKQLLIISVLANLLINVFAFAGLPPAQRSNDNTLSENKMAKQWMKGKPVRFVENKGQLTDMNENPVPFVLFKAEAPGIRMFITEKGLTYAFIKAKEEQKVEKSEVAEGKHEENLKVEWTRIDMALAGASIKKENIIREGMSTDFSQFFLAHCPEGITDVRSYEKITIRDIYPGIDWMFYNSNEKGFKYDFIVHPGADPKQIELFILP